MDTQATVTPVHLIRHSRWKGQNHILLFQGHGPMNIIVRKATTDTSPGNWFMCYCTDERHSGDHMVPASWDNVLYIKTWVSREALEESLRRQDWSDRRRTCEEDLVMQAVGKRTTTTPFNLDRFHGDWSSLNHKKVELYALAMHHRGVIYITPPIFICRLPRHIDAVAAQLGLGGADAANAVAPKVLNQVPQDGYISGKAPQPAPTPPQPWRNRPSGAAAPPTPQTPGTPAHAQHGKADPGDYTDGAMVEQFQGSVEGFPGVGNKRPHEDHDGEPDHKRRPMGPMAVSPVMVPEKWYVWCSACQESRHCAIQEGTSQGKCRECHVISNNLPKPLYWTDFEAASRYECISCRKKRCVYRMSQCTTCQQSAIPAPLLSGQEQPCVECSQIHTHYVKLTCGCGFGLPSDKSSGKAQSNCFRFFVRRAHEHSTLIPFPNVLAEVPQSKGNGAERVSYTPTHCNLKCGRPEHSETSFPTNVMGMANLRTVGADYADWVTDLQRAWGPVFVHHAPSPVPSAVAHLMPSTPGAQGEAMDTSGSGQQYVQTRVIEHSPAAPRQVVMPIHVRVNASVAQGAGTPKSPTAVPPPATTTSTASAAASEPIDVVSLKGKEKDKAPRKKRAHKKAAEGAGVGPGPGSPGALAAEEVAQERAQTAAQAGAKGKTREGDMLAAAIALTSLRRINVPIKLPSGRMFTMDDVEGTMTIDQLKARIRDSSEAVKEKSHTWSRFTLTQSGVPLADTTAVGNLSASAVHVEIGGDGDDDGEEGAAEEQPAAEVETVSPGPAKRSKRNK